MTYYYSITLPFPSSSISSCVEVGTQRLPATLDACYSFDDSDVDMDDGLLPSSFPFPSPSSSSSSSSLAAAAVDYTLNFYIDTADSNDDDEGGNKAEIVVVDRKRLARRWPYFRHLLDAHLSEASSGHVDLSAFFSLRLGQCLVDYFDGNPVQLSSLSTQDCRDLIEHADYFDLTHTLLFAFCITKLRNMENAEA
ncbi:MAG: hypothetical protein WC763_06380 [Candidatus Paceibacterota bacterium]